MHMLVFGARKGSLGEAVAVQAAAAGWHVATAGPNGEDYAYHSDRDNAVGLLEILNPDAVVWTVGINSEASLERHLYVNCVLPLQLVESWVSSLRVGALSSPKRLRQFIGISSNSAHIARTNSVAYCASKAAFSMGLRVKGRELARSWPQMLVYGYEPGLLAGTPMTEEVNERVQRLAGMHGDPVPMHRMPGISRIGLPIHPLAELIVANVGLEMRGLNGTLIRVDAGEQ